MTYSFTDTELELLRDALSCAIISEEQIATCISNPKQPLKKDSIETLKVSRRWLLGWYELQEKLGIKREPDKDAMDAISRVAPTRRGRPRKDKVTVINHVARRRGRPPKFEIKPPVSLTLYKIKKGFFDNLTVLEMAAANNVSVIDIHTFLNNQGLGHKQYKRKYRGLHFLWLVRKIKAKGYKDLADHLKVSRQCTQEKASLYGISEQAVGMFRRNKRDPTRPRPGPGLVSYLKDGMEILYYGRNIISLWKRYKDLPGFKVVKICEGDLRMEWLRLRFQEPARYRLGGESPDKFPGVSQHPNGSWHASYNKDNHFGYYKDLPTAIGVVRDYVLNGIRPTLCKGQCVRDDDQRKDINMSIERLKDLCTKKLYVAEIAQELGVSESTVRRYIKKYGIERQDMPIN